MNKILTININVSFFFQSNLQDKIYINDIRKN